VLTGLVLIGGAAAVGIEVWRANSADVTVEAFGHTFSQPPWVTLAAGAACGAAAVLGLALLLSSSARDRGLHAYGRPSSQGSDAVSATTGSGASHVVGPVRGDSLSPREATSADPGARRSP
jgi:hypothetical protein